MDVYGNPTIDDLSAEDRYNQYGRNTALLPQDFAGEATYGYAGKDAPSVQGQNRWSQEGRLDPETMEQLNRAISAGERLRTGPLLSGMQARAAGGDILRQQNVAMQGGATPERQYAALQAGAGLGAKVLGQHGPGMANEAVQRFEVGLKAKQATSSLISGRVLFDLLERIKKAFSDEGIALNETTAKLLMGSAIVSTGASFLSDSADPASSVSSSNTGMGDYPNTTNTGGQALT